MKIHVVTLFPELFSGFLETSFVGRARDAGLLVVNFVNLRPFGLGKHQSIDDAPYGGGAGMVMRVDVLASAIESMDPNHRMWRVLLTPQGSVLTQSRVGQLYVRDELVLVCGRYEGFDERVRSLMDEEISLGDFVLTGGEVAAMAIIEATVRLIQGVLGNESSTSEESHSLETGGLLEYPQYTRPAEFRGASVPDVLISGHHANVAAFRRQQAEERTRARRPDLWERYIEKKGRA